MKTMMAVGSLCLGGLPVLACSINTLKHRQEWTHKNTHTHRSHVKHDGPPYSSDEKRVLNSPHSSPYHRLSESEAAPAVRWYDLCHFTLVAKRFNSFSHMHTQNLEKL